MNPNISLPQLPDNLDPALRDYLFAWQKLITSKQLDDYSANKSVNNNLDAHAMKKDTHGVSGDIVGTSDTQTLSNKTLSTTVTYDGKEIVAIDKVPYCRGTFGSSTSTRTASVKHDITSLVYSNISASTSTDRVTITKAGIYLITAYNMYITDTPSLLGLSCFINGTQTFFNWNATNNRMGAHISYLASLSDNDYIEFYHIIYGTSKGWDGGFFNIMRIG